MDLHNLATVITPNVLYSKSKDPSKDDSFLAIEAVYSLLKYQDEFCLVSLGELEDGMKHVGEWCDIGNRFDISNGL